MERRSRLLRSICFGLQNSSIWLSWSHGVSICIVMMSWFRSDFYWAQYNGGQHWSGLWPLSLGFSQPLSDVTRLRGAEGWWWRPLIGQYLLRDLNTGLWLAAEGWWWSPGSAPGYRCQWPASVESLTSGKQWAGCGGWEPLIGQY